LSARLRSAGIETLPEPRCAVCGKNYPDAFQLTHAACISTSRGSWESSQKGYGTGHVVGIRVLASDATAETQHPGSFLSGFQISVFVDPDRSVSWRQQSVCTGVVCFRQRIVYLENASTGIPHSASECENAFSTSDQSPVLACANHDRANPNRIQISGLAELISQLNVDSRAQHHRGTSAGTRSAGSRPRGRSNKSAGVADLTRGCRVTLDQHESLLASRFVFGQLAENELVLRVFSSGYADISVLDVPVTCWNCIGTANGSSKRSCWPVPRH